MQAALCRHQSKSVEGGRDCAGFKRGLDGGGPSELVPRGVAVLLDGLARGSISGEAAGVPDEADGAGAAVGAGGAAAVRRRNDISGGLVGFHGVPTQPLKRERKEAAYRYFLIGPAKI